jgi:2-methylcitrate dehydratase PrpD
MSPPKSDKIAEFVTGFDLAAVPAALIDIAEIAFVDTVGVMLAGSQEPAAQIVCDMVEAEGAAPSAMVVGRALKTSPQNAALANGTATQALDFDLSFTSGQSAAALIPGLLPLAQTLGSTSQDLIAAYIVGCEICARTVRSFPGLSSEGGWHGAGVAGVLAAAASYARLSGVSADQIPSVIGIGASMASGLGENFGTMTKPLHAGLAGRSGLTAVGLGARGFTASATAIEGKQGFLASYARGLTWDEASFDDLGETFNLLDPGYKIKPFACGGLLHTAIEAALYLREQVQPRLDQIERIAIGATQHAANRVIDAYPWSEDSSRFSLKYLIPYALIHGAPGIDAFSDAAIDDDAVRAMSECVSAAVDPEFANVSVSGLSPSRMTIIFKNGDRLEHVVHIASGSKDTPMSEAAIKQKFLACATRAVRSESAAELYDILRNLRHQSDLSDLWGLLSTQH